MSDRNETAAVPHVPVMAEEVLCALAPVDGDTIIDGTFGAGGYSTAILCHAQCTVVGIDRDPGAIALGLPLRERFGERFILLEGRFADMADRMHRGKTSQAGMAGANARAANAAPRPPI